MNKKGEIVLRDIMFILLIATGLIMLLSVFVDEIGRTYGDETMREEYASGNFKGIMENSFYDTTGNTSKMGSNLSNSGIIELVGGGLQSAGAIISTVFLAPITFGNIIEQFLIDLGVELILAQIIGITIKASIYIIIIFTIISAFLQGGKV